MALAAVFGAALVALVSVFLAAGGEPAFAFAIFTGPEAPIASQNPVQLIYTYPEGPGKMEEGSKLTLGTLEDTGLTTLGESTVELSGEGSLGNA